VFRFLPGAELGPILPDPAPSPRPGWAAPTPGELEALDALPEAGSWDLGGRQMDLTNLGKVLFPARAGASPVTKRDLIRHYATVAPYMLPHLAGRAANLQRFPDGVDRPGFWHKQVPSHAPEWLARWHPDRGGETYFVIDCTAALAWMANYAAVEIHPWTSTVVAPDQPSWALIDIDPGPRTRPAETVTLARLYRAGLQHLGVRGLPKVTGGRGVHIWIPIAPGYRFADTSAWVGKLSRAVGATVPDLVSWSWAKDARRGRARLDYTQNAFHKTLVAPYSTRPAPGAPVSMPVTWDELCDDGLRPDRWTLRDVPARLAAVGDLWSGPDLAPQVLPAL
jgi:bifunctional non-homologous end joining protein LigD